MSYPVKICCYIRLYSELHDVTYNLYIFYIFNVFLTTFMKCASLYLYILTLFYEMRISDQTYLHILICCENYQTVFPQKFYVRDYIIECVYPTV